MVAPHDTGDLVRSLVRVPGSGRDRTLSSVCCDLSKVSPFAATVAVPQALPSAIARPLEEPQQLATNLKKKIIKKENPGKHKPRLRTGQLPNLSRSMTTAPMQQQQQLSITALTQLLQERNALREENLALQRRVILFQQLFRDKKRLTAVVKRLGVKVET